MGARSQLIPTWNHTAVKFSINYSDNFLVDPASIGADDIQYVGPQGPVTIEVGSILWSEHDVTVEYLAMPADGTWDHTENGQYGVRIRQSAVQDLGGNALEEDFLASFTLEWSEPDDGETPPFPTVVKSTESSNAPNTSSIYAFCADSDVAFLTAADFLTPSPCRC